MDEPRPGALAPAPTRSSGRAALLLVVLVAGVYALVAGDRLWAPSAQFHFVDLAHSFMAGTLDTQTPTQRGGGVDRPGDPRGYRAAVDRTLGSGGWNDWASIKTLTTVDGAEVRGRFPWAGDSGDRRHLFHTHDGEVRKIVIPQDLARTCGPSGKALCQQTHHYVSFPPFPAVAMIPAAAVFGYDTNDVLITVLLGGVNAGLLFLFLQLLSRRGHSARDGRENLWLTLLFAFGSVAFFATVRGEVWFTALVMGVTLNLCYMMAALDTRRPLVAGLLLGLATATRVPVAFCVVFFAWQLFLPGGRWRGDRWGEILRKGALFALPILACGGALMAYNHARFDSVLEFGHTYLSGGAGDRIRDHGLFNTWYLNGNLSAALLNLPRVMGEAPYVQITKHGLGLLFTTPALWLLMRPARQPALRGALWFAVVAAAVPGLLYQNTGWEQFGYRFALDYFPYLVALLAVGGRPLTVQVKGLILFGVLVNLFGAITFGRFVGFYY